MGESLTQRHRDEDGDEDGEEDAGGMGDAAAGTGGGLVLTTTVGGSSVGCEGAAGVQAERISAARAMPKNIFAFIPASCADKSRSDQARIVIITFFVRFILYSTKILII
jgi:hypothetical protein